MPKYTVIHTPLRHGKKGEKKAKTYDLGDEIALIEDEAALIGDNVEAVSTSKPKSEKAATKESPKKAAAKGTK